MRATPGGVRAHLRAVILGCSGAGIFALGVKLAPHDAGVAALGAGVAASALAILGLGLCYRQRKEAGRLDWEGGAADQVIRVHGDAYRSWFVGQSALWSGALLLAAGALVLAGGPRLPVVVVATMLVGMAVQSLRGVIARGLRPWELGLGWAEFTPGPGRPDAAYALTALTLEERIRAARLQDRRSSAERGHPSSRFRVMFQSVDLGRRQPPARRVDLSRRWGQAWGHELRVRLLGLGLVASHAGVLGLVLWLALDFAGVQTVEAATRERDRPMTRVSSSLDGLSDDAAGEGAMENESAEGDEGEGVASAAPEDEWTPRYPDDPRAKDQRDDGDERSDDGDSLDSSMPGLGRDVPTLDAPEGSGREARGTIEEARVIEGRACKKKHAHGKDCDGAVSTGKGKKGDGEAVSATAGSGPPSPSGKPTIARGPVTEDAQASRRRSSSAGTGKGNPLGGRGSEIDRQRSSSSTSAPIVINIVPDGPARRLMDRKAQQARGEAPAAPGEAFRRPGSGESAEAESWQPLPARLAELLPPEEHGSGEGSDDGKAR